MSGLATRWLVFEWSACEECNAFGIIGIGYFVTEEVQYTLKTKYNGTVTYT
jgi:hypothetical protein